MKLIIKEYINSLNEDIGLNELIPKLLLLKGYTVINHPQKGTRQFGVDIFAEKNGSPYLITIKAGNLTRTNWDTGPTALKQSLDDIIDTYIPVLLPKKYVGKKINIFIICNGDIDQAVHLSLIGYERKYNDYEFRYFNLDNLTDFVQKELLNEYIVSSEDSSSLRKCLALINEVDFKFDNYNTFVNRMIDDLANENRKVQIGRKINKIIMIQKIICEWDNENGSCINKIKCCELLLLRIVAKLLVKNEYEKDFLNLFDAIVNIYLAKLDCFFKTTQILIDKKRLMHPEDEFGHKLKLFEILGLLSIYGLILLLTGRDRKEIIIPLQNLIVNILVNYPGACYVPLESNTTEISLVLLFLYFVNDKKSASNYAHNLLYKQTLNYNHFNNFPFPYDDYYDAIMSKQQKTDRFESTLVLESLFEWNTLLDDSEEWENEILQYYEVFQGISFQLWFYEDEDEVGFYEGKRDIGTCFLMPQIESLTKYKSILLKIYQRIKSQKYFACKKNIDYVSFIASRLYRMPINPFFYLREFDKK